MTDHGSEVVAATVRGAVVATLAAGVVGVLRQRAEVEAGRRGELTSPSAALVIPPRRPAGPVGERLASWVPSRPASRVGRAAAALWAAPLTIIGVAVAAFGGGARRWDTERGCLVVEGVGGPSSAALRAVGADANTIGQVVLSRSRVAPEALLDHEAVHVRQAERLGPLLFPAYVWLAARYGYRDHPLERAARAGARAATTRRRTSSLS